MKVSNQRDFVRGWEADLHGTLADEDQVGLVAVRDGLVDKHLLDSRLSVHAVRAPWGRARAEEHEKVRLSNLRRRSVVRVKRHLGHK